MGSRPGLAASSTLSGKIVQKFVQRLAAGFVSCPMRAIAGAGNLDAHGFSPAVDFPAEGMRAIPAAADDDILGSVSIIGGHTQRLPAAIRAGGSRSRDLCQV